MTNDEKKLIDEVLNSHNGLALALRGVIEAFGNAKYNSRKLDIALSDADKAGLKAMDELIAANNVILKLLNKEKPSDPDQ